MTSSNGNIFRVTGPLCGESTGPGEFPTRRPVTRSFDIFFDLHLNKRLSKQPWGWWFETPSWHYDVSVMGWVCQAADNNHSCNPVKPDDVYMRQWTRSPLLQAIACGLVGPKPLPEPTLTFNQSGNILREIWIKIQMFSLKNVYLKMSSANWHTFCSCLTSLSITKM